MPDNIQQTLQLKEITDCFSGLKIVEKRCLSNDFVELVFHRRDLDEWHRILNAFLGLPTKPQGTEPTPKDLEITSTTGGIRMNQTLFEQEFANGIVIAKFWPWEDQRHITLRMALLMK